MVRKVNHHVRVGQKTRPKNDVKLLNQELQEKKQHAYRQPLLTYFKIFIEN